MTPRHRRDHRRRGAPRTTTTARGYGSTHKRDRAKALTALIPGTPCPLCRRPMHTSQALDYDHVLPIALGGRDGPKQLTHASCNRAKGARLGLPPQTAAETPDSTVRRTITSFD